MSSDSQRTPDRVILIQADDLGYDDIACNGNDLVETPNLDRLCGASVNCTDFTVNPVCAPSRATLLAGRHFLKTGVSHVHGGKDFLAKNEQTLGDLFSANDWTTAMYGKWHSGHIDGYFPWERGFQTAYMSRLYRHRDSFGFLNGEKIEQHRWSDEVIFDYAIDCLKQHRDDRLFLYIPTMTPHTPLQAPEDLVKHYESKGLSTALSTLYAMVTLLDTQIGRLMAYLDDNGMTDNTLLLFTSDNGPAVNVNILSDEDRRIRKTSVRKGWKGDIYENGVRAPLYLRWPSRYRPGEVTTPLDQVDLFPTLMEWCGLERSGQGQPLDGKSIVGLFDRTVTAEKLAYPIFNYAHEGWITSERPYSGTGLPGEYNPVSAEEKAALTPDAMPVSVRDGRFKLLLNAEPPSADGTLSGTVMLVDLDADPGETTDISGEHPEVFARLRQALDRWVADVKNEPSSFGYAHVTVDGDTKIMAKLVCACSDSLQNTVSRLQGWTEEGQYAEYLLDVRRPGRYAVTGVWDVKSPAGDVQLAFAVGDEEPGETVQLPAGECRLRVVCVGADVAGEGKVLDRVELSAG